MNPSYGNPRLRRGTKFPTVMAVAVPILVIAGSVHRANADVTISSGTTQNMSCANGVCAPTASDAVLNVGDLEALLASGNITVTTTGSGVQANNIAVTSNLGWSANTLTFDAYQSIAVSAPVTVSNGSGLSLLTDDGGGSGELAFSGKGHATFRKLSSSLAINGTSFTLVKTIAALASAIQKNPAGDYALAANYDAGKDGTYTTSPVGTSFSGEFEGLANSISNLSINDSADTNVGLFAEVGAAGSANHVILGNIVIDATYTGYNSNTGTLIGINHGTVEGSQASGSVSSSSTNMTIGGLIGTNYGTVSNSSAVVAVAGGDIGGGLVGQNWGLVSHSHASGYVSDNGNEGGLVGINYRGVIDNSYATGSVSNSGWSWVGGLAGGNAQGAIIKKSFAIGAVASGGGKRRHYELSLVGGLVGANNGEISQCYEGGAVSDGAKEAYVGGLGSKLNKFVAV